MITSELTSRGAGRRVAASVIDAIGNTPVVELSRLLPNPDVRLLAKLEGTNPSGSVKDRVARYMVEEVGVAAVPGSSFYPDPDRDGRTQVRFAFCKRMETLRRAALLLTALER